MKNILEWLESIQLQAPDRILFSDEKRSVNRTQFLHTAQSIGTALARFGTRNTPVALLMPRGVDCLAAMMGVAYSGNFYVVLDDAMPASIWNRRRPWTLTVPGSVSRMRLTLSQTRKL